jgi:hypothetical protein
MSGSVEVVLDQMWIHDSVRGIEINDSIGPASLTVSDSLIENVEGLGVVASATTVALDRVAIRDVLFGGETVGSGRGVSLQVDLDTGIPATGNISRSLVRRARGASVRVSGSQVAVDSTFIADAIPESGIGVGVRIDSDTGVPSDGVMTRSNVERVTQIGVLVTGASASLDAVVVRDTQPDADQMFGRGVMAQYDDNSTPSTMAVTNSLIAGNRDLGLLLSGSSGTVVATAVVDTLSRGSDGLYGDGLVVVDGDYLGSQNVPASLSVDASLVARNARAGWASFGGALALARSRSVCDEVDLAIDAYAGSEAELTDLGGNFCGCPKANEECRASSVVLQPPTSGDL